jgi:hypothetical protein
VDISEVEVMEVAEVEVPHRAQPPARVKAVQASVAVMEATGECMNNTCL